MSIQHLIPYAYIVASIFFIIGLKKLGSADTARKGNALSAAGMLLAVVATLLNSGMSYGLILLGVAVGSIIGAIAAKKVAMTGMPEMVALFNGFGGIASLLVGWAEYQRNMEPSSFTAGAIIVAVFIGGITLTGSLLAYLKLSEKIDGKPVLFAGQKQLNGLLLIVSLGLAIWFATSPATGQIPFYAVIALSFLLGVLITIPIGGADMPVVIALLNSYSGLAACAAGFVILNNVLIVSGSLVGASGLILTNIMCKAMNRSLANVLFAGVGSGGVSQGKAITGEAKPVSASDVYYMLEAASSVIFVPGYGMAVAQAQHAVQELSEILEHNGTEVKFAIHPVAGRMPGHMNVLLAEANVPYEMLVEPEDVNPNMSMTDIAIVIGANDVVNPAAKDDDTSPLYGMPIIEVDQANVCIVLKRSLKPGFAGVENPLFFKENSRMLFGDAKATIQALVSEFKDA